MKIPVAIKILNEATGPKANVEFMDVSILKTKSKKRDLTIQFKLSFYKDNIYAGKLQAKYHVACSPFTFRSPKPVSHTV